MFRKLNEIFDKSNNRLLRFSISFIVILTPFLCVSFLVLIAVHNYLRAAVLVLLLINSFYASTRDNKLVLAFIGLIPIGFYVVTSPLFLGYVLGIQALNLGEILWGNKVMTVLSGVSIYGIIKAAKGASSIYEWFMNTGIGGYFFPNYKILKDQLNVKNQIITTLITENNALINSLKTAKDAIKQLQITAIDTFNRMEEKLYKQKEQELLSDQPSNDAIILPVKDTVSIAQLHDNLVAAINHSESSINTMDNRIIHNQENTQQAITLQQRSNAIIPVSDSTITAVQKVFTGAAVLIAGDQLIKMLGGDGSILVQGFNMAKNTLGPWIIPTGTATAYALGEVATRTFTNTTDIIKKATVTVTSTYRETQKLILKGIMNIAENTTSGNVPDIGNKPQNQLKDPKFGNMANASVGVHEVSLVRKPGNRDFIVTPGNPKLPPLPIHPSTPPVPPAAPAGVKITFSKGKIKVETQND